MRRAAALFLAAALCEGGEFRRTLHAFSGATPEIDGAILPGEWDDATHFYGVEGWTQQFTGVSSARDLSVRGWVKHDRERLYFAFDVTDDVLYGVDTPLWPPEENPRAHEPGPEGWPWLGDGVQLLLNASNRWQGNEKAAGDGSSWQLMCSVSKSTKGPGTAGLIEGWPLSPEAVRTYAGWFASKAQEAAVRVKPGGGGYVVEWAIRYDPCVEIERGIFYAPQRGSRAMGLNIGVTDADEKAKGEGNFANLHHEGWWAGEKGSRTELRQWGTLWILSENRSPATRR